MTLLYTTTGTLHFNNVLADVFTDGQGCPMQRYCQTAHFEGWPGFDRKFRWYPFVFNNVQKLDFARVFLEEIKTKYCPLSVFD